MGTIDRTVRSVIALAFAILYFTGIVPELIGLILLIISAVFILTSYLGFCPVYALFRLKTRSKQS